MTAQLAFDLPARPSLRRADFFVSPANALALATLEAGNWPRGKMLLVGPPGSGKTHLAHIWAGQSGAQIMEGGSLALADIEARARTALVVEEADSVAGDPRAETALFHLHNLMAERGLPLLLTAPAPVRDWGLALPDLISRLEATAVTRLEAPDDALLSAVLVKLFTDHQLVVPYALILWLVQRMERSLGAARQLVATLDARALARGGPVSRQLAAELLDNPAEFGDSEEEQFPGQLPGM